MQLRFIVLATLSALLEVAQLCINNCSYLGPGVAITSSYWIDISRNSNKVTGFNRKQGKSQYLA